MTASPPSQGSAPQTEGQRIRAEGVEIRDLSIGGNVEADDFPTTISR